MRGGIDPYAVPMYRMHAPNSGSPWIHVAPHLVVAEPPRMSGRSSFKWRCKADPLYGPRQDSRRTESIAHGKDVLHIKSGDSLRLAWQAITCCHAALLARLKLV